MTRHESRKDDTLNEVMTMKKSLKSSPCDDDVENEDILKRSYRSRQTSLTKQGLLTILSNIMKYCTLTITENRRK